MRTAVYMAYMMASDMLDTRPTREPVADMEQDMELVVVVGMDRWFDVGGHCAVVTDQLELDFVVMDLPEVVSKNLAAWLVSHGNQVGVLQTW